MVLETVAIIMSNFTVKSWSCCVGNCNDLLKRWHPSPTNRKPTAQQSVESRRVEDVWWVLILQWRTQWSFVGSLVTWFDRISHWPLKLYLNYKTLYPATARLQNYDFISNNIFQQISLCICVFLVCVMSTRNLHRFNSIRFVNVFTSLGWICGGGLL